VRHPEIQNRLKGFATRPVDTSVHWGAKSGQMKRIALMLVFVSLPCMAQEQPRPGLLGHRDCKIYFSASRLFRTMAGNVALHDFQVWGLSKSEVDRWVKKEHKKYPGLCYVLDPEHQDLAPLRLHFYGVYFTEGSFFYSEHRTATETSTQNVPVEGNATVYDNSGQRVGTAEVTGTAKVETTTRYPVDVTVRDQDVSAEVDRLNADGSWTKAFHTIRSRTLGRGGLAEAFAHDPHAKTLDDCLKFISTEAGLEKKK
jgi:hypothetical protein